MTYATVADVQARMTRSMTEQEQAVCAVMLEDASAMIDAMLTGKSTCGCSNPGAPADARMIVACRMVIRALGDGSTTGYPIGANQGSMSGLGYSQSWTVGGGGSTGELYIGKADRQLLGLSNSIGSYSPVQELAPNREGCV